MAPSRPGAERLLDGPDAEDRALGNVDEGSELRDPVHPEIGDGERAARVLIGGERARPGPLRELARRGGDLPDAQTISPAHDGNDQPRVQGHGEADVDLVAQDDAVSLDHRVDQRVLAERRGGGPHDEIGVGDLCSRRPRSCAHGPRRAR